MEHVPDRSPGGFTPRPGRRPSARRELPRHPISRAASDAGLHPQTLREYERRGLLRPARTDGGKRLFSDADVERAARIRHLTDDGLTVQMARRFLRLEDNLQLAIDRIRVLEDQNVRLSGRLQQLELARRGARP